MAPQTPQQTTPLTPPSTPPTPKGRLLDLLPTTTALPGPPLRLSPSPSPISSSSSSCTSNLPRITITLNNRTMPPLPWRPCNLQRPRYESFYLVPPRQLELSRQHRQQQQQQQQREHERQTQQLAEEEELLLPKASPLSVPETLETQQLPSPSLLRPIARELIRWRMLTFYKLNAKLTTGAATAAEAKARANILAAGVDWQRTWVLLRGQRARYLARERRSLGLLSKMNLRGLGVLRVVHRAVASVGVSVGQLILAVEAFAKREGREGLSMSVGGLVARQEWEVLAGVLLMDREMQGREREVVFPSSRAERDEVWHQICRTREEVARRYFSVLEYEEWCAGFCCFASCGKRRMVYQLSRREHARLDGSLELLGQLRRGVHSTGSGPRRRESESESESDNGDEGRRDNGPQVQAQKKRVRISEDVDEEQEVRSESASRASWDSEEKRQKRRKERREFVFGKEDEDEDEDEDESDAEHETDEQREEQERKRKQSLERILAANAKWNEEYADCGI